MGPSELRSPKGYGVRKSGASRAPPVHIGDGVQASVTAASRLLCVSRRLIRGSANSPARMLTGVDEKQLVTQRCTLCQKASSFWVIAWLGVKRSAP